MRLVWQWIEIEREFPANWAEARLVLSVADRDRDRALALLGAANPLRHGDTIRIFCSRRGGFGPDALRRALLQLDRKEIAGKLELGEVTEVEREPEVERPTLAAEWDIALAVLSDDWSDLYAEVQLTSTDQLERAALLMSPLNPLRDGGRTALRFRAARRFGYGASAAMVRRCFERVDAEGIPGALHVLRVLSDSKPVGTQGPVWHVGGRTV